MKSIKLNYTSHTLKPVFTAVLLVVFCLLGCKKYFDPPYVFEEQNVSVKRKRSVLLIAIDGATGADIKAIAPPKITAMLANSKYSFDAYSDFLVSDGGTWKNLMTGVGVGKHGIIDSTFEVPLEGDGHEHDAQTAWPTFIERLQASGKMRRAVAITPWASLNNKLLVYADQPLQVANDLAVKDSALVKLKTGNNDLVIVNFNQPNKVGLAAGFSPDVPDYKDAILKTDGYIGELIEALKNRKTYASEDWLVIVTSTHGGTGKSYGAESTRARDRNVFTMYYAADFKPLEINAPVVIDGVKFSAGTILARLPAADAAQYNLGATGEFTIEFKLRVHAFGTLNAPIFFKTSSPANTASGWWFVHDGSNGGWRFALKGSQSSPAQSTKTVYSKDLGTAGPPKMTTDQWYTLAAKIYMLAGKRYMIIYQDGVKASNPMEITGQDVSNAIELIAGWKSGYGNNANQSVANIRFWNTALPDSKLLEDACAAGVSPSDPYYANLIGYWPANDGLSYFKNYSPLAIGKNMKLEGNFIWESLVKPACGTEVPVLPSQFLIRNSDVAAQILYWYGVKIEDSWKLDGKAFLVNYESEFIK
ncbi:alkaline phosphatase family protein [Pedobacter sp. MC2016-24]|uniref:alkaline phosphatase family protein n=1 Tax=Pedobacter sp. MC2016-24 TaxID=2780090 RepID=UPI0018805EE2|nr:alkaline phosphatase family protein [Pedobacter sp. MC2016-24]MBE9600451.1 DUF4983 domain-containing protein [Pedobacter sp. MC2016-24]